MRRYKVNFTLKYGLPVFSNIPEIIEKAEIREIAIKFAAGGWETAGDDLCYHEWKSIEDESVVAGFLKEQYENSFHSLEVNELPLTSAA